MIKNEKLFNITYRNQYTDFWIKYRRNYIENRDNERNFQKNKELEEKNENQKTFEKIKAENDIIQIYNKENRKQEKEEAVKKFYLITEIQKKKQIHCYYIINGFCLSFLQMGICLAIIFVSHGK